MLKQLDVFRKKLPSRAQWGQFFSVLGKKEKIVFVGFLALALGAFLFLNISFYLKNTTPVPKSGGEYKEGVVGQPRFVNPLYLSSQDIDRDIVEILFSGLLKYDQNGQITNDLSLSYEIKDGGETFEFTLKEAVWHDEEPLTAGDIAFTVGLAQNPEYQSPLRVKFTGVLVEQVAENKVAFKLPKSYPGFLETLTFKILPKHIFKDISPNSLPWSLISKKYLVGSGPFQLEKISQDNSGFIRELVLEKNKNYFDKPAFLNKISFLFFKDDKSLLKAINSGEIDGMAVSVSEPNKFLLKDYTIELPRYFALFFNLTRENIFSDKKMRRALSLAIDRQKIIDKVFDAKAKMVDSAVMPTFFGLKAPDEKFLHSFNQEEADKALNELGFILNPTTKKREKTKTTSDFTFTKTLTLKNQGEEVKKLQQCLAQFPDIYPEGEVSGYFGEKTRLAVVKFQEKYTDEILKPIGLAKGTGDVKPMTRDKLNQVCFQKPAETNNLEITITTGDKFPLADIAQIIKENLETFGISVKIENVSLADLQTEVLSKKKFDILLFGEALGSIPDPFPFWHSSQKDYPGLNVASYSSKTADKLLETSRETEGAERQQALEKFQDIVNQDLPAVFLIRPDFIYTLSSEVKGFEMKKITEPSKRFSTIEDWYLKTKRVWK